MNQTIPCALVTGSGKRLGREIAIHLANQGYDVALHHFSSTAETSELSSLLKSRFPDRIFPLIHCNLLDWKLSAHLYNQLPPSFSNMSLLINSASIFQSAQLESTSQEMIMDHFAIHFFSPFQLMKQFKTLYHQGSIINILDCQISSKSTKHSAYLLSKKALADLTQMAALEWAPHIRVNGIAPGPVLPPVNHPSEHFESVVLKTPLKKSVEMGAVMQAIDFFIHNTNVTGQIVYIDSGSHLNT